MKIAAIIPAYNAEHTVGKVVGDVREHVDRIFVIDDGSEDNTAEAARRSGAEVIRYSPNKGKGAALAAGFEAAEREGFEICITVDADGQNSAEEIPRLLEPIRGGRAQVVVGSRSELMGEMRTKRRLANRTSSFLISLAAGQRIEDTQSGFRAIPTRLWRNARVSASRYDAEAEFLITAAWMGAKIVSVPVDSPQVDGIPTSHYRDFIDSARIARVIWRALLRRGRSWLGARPRAAENIGSEAVGEEKAEPGCPKSP